MKQSKLIIGLIGAAALCMASFSASAAMVQKMGLSDLVGNADKVFRGTVLTKEPGTVRAGGSELDTVIYQLSVDDALKGDFGSGKEARVIEIMMLGSLKEATSAEGQQRLFRMDINPDLQVGSNYVLFTTTPSAVGLSTTVGLEQGLFRVFASDAGNEMTANGLGNQGLFGGPVSYDQLKSAINDELN
jgi:hypothetical protein